MMTSDVQYDDSSEYDPLCPKTSLIPLSQVQEDTQSSSQRFLRIFMYSPEGPQVFAIEPCWILGTLQDPGKILMESLRILNDPCKGLCNDF